MIAAIALTVSFYIPLHNATDRRNDRVVIILFSFVLIFRVLLSTLYSFGPLDVARDSAVTVPLVRREVGTFHYEQPPAGVGDTWLNVATVAYGPSLGGLALASDSDKAFSIWPEPLGSF